MITTQASRRRKRLDGADFEPVGYFLLRTPLLPYDELERWGGGEDRDALRGWLRELLARPEIIEALHVATPALLDALAEWRADPDSKKGRRAEEALVRYAIRMSARSTPFGLFAGCTLGHIGETSRLRLAPRGEYRRHSRLDTGYLFSLAEELNRDRALRAGLSYRPNSSIYRAAGRLRYAEARYGGPMIAYHLVAVEPDDFLEAALARARDGATPGEIAAAVVAADPDGEIAIEDALAYVDDLIDNQLLVSELWPAVTGPEAVHGLVTTLERNGRAEASRLRRAHEALEELDRRPLGNEPRCYRDIAGGLEPLPQRADRRRLYQVDLYKPGELTLSAEVFDAIAQGIEALHRIGSPNLVDRMEGFRDRFVDRYGMMRLVPLVEALDDEVGVGLPSAGIGADTSPLLDGLDFSHDDPADKVNWREREEMLLAKLMDAHAAGAAEIVITDNDLARLETPKRPPLPDSFQSMTTLSAASEEALAAGDFQVWVRSAFGPSGARLMGRFCHGDEELTREVIEQLRAEEGLDPDAVFAEIAHVPMGRLGNIASRPLLRGWEIPYLGVSGAPLERQIPIDDLLVTVEGPDIVLYSARLRRRVMPRLASAHNFIFGSLSVYRFLCSLSMQSVRTPAQWFWRPFEKRPFLPRVRCGKAILVRAQWYVTAEEIKDLAARRDGDRFAAARRWRERRGIPRQVLFGEDDEELLVDFDNILSLDAFVAAVSKSEEVVLVEFWPGPGALPVRGPEGRFVHDLTVPFVRRRKPVHRPVPVFTGDVERILPPTSSWLYLKLYAGSATGDLVLRDAIAPLVARAREAGVVDRWFFIRYADPQNHLRVRFGGDSARLRAIVDWLPELLDPLLREGRIARWQLDTYEREVERYGGARAMELSEEIFCADSEMVLDALQELEGDRGAAWRWRLALAGIDRYFDDFGFTLDARRDQLAKLRRAFGDEFSVGPELTQQLAQRVRESFDELYALLTSPNPGGEHPLAGSLAALDRRSSRLAPIVHQLRELESRGELTTPLGDLLSSYIHMFVNRLIRSDARAHELVLYDLLQRITQSRLARAPEARARQESDPTPARSS